MTKPNKNDEGEKSIPEIPVLTIDEAIKAGHIERERAIVTIPKGYKTRAGVRLEHDITETYYRLKAKDLAGMLAMVAGDKDEALKLFNTQFDIKAQVPLKYKMQKRAGKPKAATTKAVTALRAAAQAMVEMGQAPSVEKAIQSIMAEANAAPAGKKN